MTDSEVIQIIWGNPELKSQFEIDPYGLSQRELIILPRFWIRAFC